MAYVIYYKIVESDFGLLSRYYIYFQTNTLGKGMNTLASNCGLNNTTIIILLCFGIT